jgi:diguanylate cyclase (GGDEF)-like protein
MLPVEVYVSTVDALYSDGRSLFAGTASASLAAMVTAWATDQIAFAICSVLLTLIGWVRWIDMRTYRAQSSIPATVENARRWEVRYNMSSAAFVTVLSSWCFLTFALTNEPAVQLISFSVSLAYLVGVTGRNFSSDQLVTTQTLCAAIPMIAGLLAQLNVYHAFLACLLIPFFMSLRIISARLRKILFEAVVATHNVTEIANRFDTALNNMPHGLCMFDAERRLVVANERFLQLLRVDPSREWRGAASGALVREATRQGAFEAPDVDDLAENIERRIASPQRTTLSTETRDAQSLQFTFQPMDTGGCVVLVEDITERRNAEAKIERLASYDALTGLANRALFQRTFEEVLGKDGAYAVHFIDLDQFKRVNDTLGHPCGDALLCAVADRLRAIVRQTDYISRFGGDEFVLLQPILKGRHEQVGDMASRIIARLSEPYHIAGHEIVIGASIGIAIAPNDGAEFDELLKSADMALYAAKAEGRGLWRRFEKDMDVKAQARRTLELDIRQALANNDFKVFYQPIVNVRTGRVSACEALLRWVHSERGLVPPSEFIPVAEEMGLIVELGNAVLRQACSECVNWPDDVAVTVNLSPIQFRRSDIPRAVQEALNEYGLSPDRLVVEITESVLLEDTSSTHSALARLRELGVQIALDDFGTGYSSLSYLHRFPLNKIKVDRSFLQGVEDDPKTMTLLRGVSRLSKDLGMSVVVEGVEKQAQLSILLREDAIDEVQGFLFGRALPSDMIRRRLGKQILQGVRRVA